MLPPCLEPGILEAGVDEAGRGCLAGPVYAAAVILPDDFSHPMLTDSKQLTDNMRRKLRPLIVERALAYGIGIATEAEIDTYNILNATFLAMHRAIDALQVRPGALVIDGNRFRAYHGIGHTTVVHGDALLANIAAASILAKTMRDDAMIELHRQYPQYMWDINKGYPTKAHRRAIAEHGVSPYHRLSFRLLPEDDSV